MNKLLLSAALVAQCMLAAAAAQAASFDCAHAGSVNEKLICADPELSAMDDRLGKTFRQARARAEDKRAFRKQSDAQWALREQTCHDRACLHDWYARRQGELQALLDGAPGAAPVAAIAPAKPKLEAKAETKTEVKTEAKAEVKSEPVKTEAKAEPKAAPKVAAKAEAKPAAPKQAAAVPADEPPLAPEVVAAAKAAMAKARADAIAKQGSADKLPAAISSQPPIRPVSLKLSLNATQIAGVAPAGASPWPHYVRVDKGQYFYEDARHGNAMVVVRYFGVENGQHILEAVRGKQVLRYTCSNDCAYIGELPLPGDEQTDMTIVRNDSRSLPSLIVNDALNGLLVSSTSATR